MRYRGASAVEYMILVAMSVLVVLGLMRYLRFAVAGRLKDGAEQLGGGMLLNPDGSRLALLSCQDSWIASVPISGGRAAVTTSYETGLQLTTLASPTPALPECQWRPNP